MSGAGLFRYWAGLPLYVRILIGLVLGVVAGVSLGPRASALDLPARLILRLLGALAPPLILVAVVHALLTADIKGAVAEQSKRLQAKVHTGNCEPP